MKIAGFDIGGANTDRAVVDFDKKGQIKEIISGFEYLPMWQEKEHLSTTLTDLLGDDKRDIQAVGICMTAELVDAYQTKKEGVLDIARKVQDTFNLPLGFIGYDGVMDFSQLQENPLHVAAANWVATSRLAGSISPECIMIDTGSTTTDIIPIKEGKQCAKGKSDLQRLGTGELVYSGVLRTNLAALVSKVPLDSNWIRVASELFAISADIHLVLGNISEDDYSCSTPDGTGKTVDDSMRRISRVMCSDMDVLTPQDIRSISEYIYLQQVEDISKALQEVSKRNGISKVVTTGLGMDIIGAKASELAGISYVGMDQLLNKNECMVAPAVGTAILMWESLR